MGEEILEIIDECGRVIGRAPRSACHSDPRLIHWAVHVLVRRPSGNLLLQLRSMRKDVQPGKWDTSVGGHVAPGETVLAAARRETGEELGFRPAPLKKLYEYLWRSERETELVATYLATHSGPVKWPEDEIDQVREWTIEEIESQLGSGCFTPNFEQEFALYEEKETRP